MEKEKKPFRLPIIAKAGILVAVLSVVLVLVPMVYFTLVTKRTNENNYRKIATNTANTISEVVDIDDVKYLKDKIKSIYDESDPKPRSDEWGSDAWNAYIEQFKDIPSDPVFVRTLDYIRNIASVITNDINCIYLSFVDPVNKNMVYILDSAPEEDACPPGCIDELYPVNYALIDDPTVGFPAYTTNTDQYGYLVTAGAPIYDSDNKVIGYSMVDISMATIQAAQRDSIIRLFVYLLITVLALGVAVLLIVHFVFVKPVSKLNKVARAYGHVKPEEAHQMFEELSINTRDEISDLAESMKKIERDVTSKIGELTVKNDELARSQLMAEKMTELANTDGLTGVYNKSAYNAHVKSLNKSIVEGELNNFGVAMIDLNYLKMINDQFGHNFGDDALIKLTDIIRSVFTNSPIYRVGGDEFVVLLFGKEYKNADNLIKKFNHRIDASGKKGHVSSEHTSAAIGYAYYDDATDKTVDDVFKKADKAMYDRKHQMKEEM